MDSHIIQNSLMPPLLSDLLLQKGPEVLAHDGHWSRHQSMTFPTQIPSLWRRRERGGCCHNVIPNDHERQTQCLHSSGLENGLSCCQF
jgi:hypothetical protein